MIIRKKKELRLKVNQATAKISLSEKKEQSLKVFNAIEKTGQFQKAKTVALFWSLWDELPTHEVAKRWAAEKRIVLPKVSGNNMEFLEFKPGCGMEEGELRVLSPKGGEEVNPEEIDLIIVPGVAFDAEGKRLGRGKGYYDEFIKRTNAFTIGVCMSHQKIEEVPCEAHDKKVDMLITPDI